MQKTWEELERKRQQLQIELDEAQAKMQSPRPFNISDIKDDPEKNS